MNLFGKARQAPSTADTIKHIRETMGLLEKREKFLETKIEHEAASAKAFVAQRNRKAATMALRRKKAYENQVEKVSTSRFRLEEQVMTLENANVNLETIDAMKRGAAALKEIHRSKNLNIDTIDSTMEDIREQMDIANQINEVIAEPLSMQSELEDDDIEKELEELEDEMAINKMGESSAARVPDQKTSVPAAAHANEHMLPRMPDFDEKPSSREEPAEQNKEDEEFAKLEAELIL